MTTLPLIALSLSRGCRRPYTPSTNTARAEAGGIQGGPPPCAGGPGTRRFLAYLCLLSLREKVGRGAEHGKAMLMRSARIGRCWGYQPRKISPGVGRVGPLVGAGAKSNDLFPRGQHPLEKNYKNSRRQATWCPSKPVIASAQYMLSSTASSAHSAMARKARSIFPSGMTSSCRTCPSS